MTLIDKNSINLSNEQRYELFMQSFFNDREAWILTDEHGAVMLTEDEEDYVPFWPNEEMTLLWATDEWDHCTPKRLSFDEVRTKWLPGMEEDELCLIIFPAKDLSGQLFYPYEFEEIIAKKLAKIARKN